MEILKVILLLGTPLVAVVFNILQFVNSVKDHNIFMCVIGGVSVLFCVAAFLLLTTLVKETW